MAEQTQSYVGSFSGGSDESGSVAELFPAVINLNVGGRIFTTHLSTLTKDPNNMLAAMFSGRHPVSKNQDGRYFIDVDGDIFAHVLNYLRFEKLPPVNAAMEVYEYAEYFGIQSLVEELKVFEAVEHHLYLEKVKTFYPNFQTYFSNLKDKISAGESGTSVHHTNPNYPRKVRFYDETKSSTYDIPYQPHPKDRRGEHLMNLIQSELYKRGYDVEFTEIPGRGIVYEFRFEPNKLFSLRRKVNLETTLKMLDELQSITGNTEELLRHKKLRFT